MPDMLDGTGHYIYAVGYADGTIRPNANISRSEVAAIFFRLLKSDIQDKNVTTSNTFEDVQSGQWFNTAVSTMEKLGVVKGRSAEFFDPDAPITRAEFSVICASFDRRQINGSTIWRSERNEEKKDCHPKCKGMAVLFVKYIDLQTKRRSK